MECGTNCKMKSDDQIQNENIIATARILLSAMSISTDGPEDEIAEPPTPPTYDWFGCVSDEDLFKAIEDTAHSEGLDIRWASDLKRTLEIMYLG